MLPEVPSDKILHMLGAVRKLLDGGHLADARRACELILRVAPEHGQTLSYLGQVARREGRHDEAIGHLSAALRLLPDDRDLPVLLAKTWRKAGQADRAEALLAGYLAKAPDDVAALVEFGRNLMDLGRVAEARDVFGRAVSMAPRNQLAQSMLGMALRQLNDRAGAFEAFSRALELAPDDVIALNGIGNEHLEAEQFGEAIDCYRRAVAIQPTMLKSHKNLAFTLSLANRLDEAEAEFRALLAKTPQNSEARMDFGLFLLSTGAYAEGWREYEHRWQFPKFDEQDWGGGLPRWTGPGQPAEHVLLWGEQGIGDHILYGTMLPDLLARMDGLATIAVEERLVPLFGRAFAGDRVRVVARGAPHGAGVQCPFGSMGAFVRLDAADFSDGAFLRAEPDRQAALRRRYAALGRPGDRLLGLSWRSINWVVGSLKSLDLDALLPVLRRPGCTWISLQYGEVAAELESFAARHGIVIHQDPDIDATRDIDGLAAQIAALDGVVSTSNSTVHLTGALGRPCWVLLPAGRGRMWYWPREGERSPWYSSIRLVRQPQAGDWSGAVRRLSEVLDDWC